MTVFDSSTKEKTLIVDSTVFDIFIYCLYQDLSIAQIKLNSFAEITGYEDFSRLLAGLGNRKSEKRSP